MAPQAFQAAKKFLWRGRIDHRRHPENIQEKGSASDRDKHDEDRYEFESGFIAVASRHPA
jgi:hypothetical protein